ncbi:MAG: hypothetical protein ISQ99_03315 [Flavobacteriales bacterium]|nr:hypothetical protein [Flavobacteriales bacterium]MBL6869074.1 hypothetical protein [Flavobacteriales bacterium]
MKNKNLKFLSILFVMGVVILSSCNKEKMMTDSQLINAIQKASKLEVEAKDLPSASVGVLSRDFSEQQNERTLLANGLGYEVRMSSVDRPDDGSNGGGDGDRPDDGSNGGGDGDRPDDGSNGDGDGDRPDDGSDGDGDGDRPDDGSDGDVDINRPNSFIYFDLDGRLLGDRPNDGSNRPNDGSNGDENRPNGGS